MYFNTQPIENTIEEINQQFILRFNNELYNFIQNDENENFNFVAFKQTEDPVSEFEQLLRSYNIEPNYIWKGNDTSASHIRKYKKLRALYLNAALSAHPDKNGEIMEGLWSTIQNNYEKYKEMVNPNIGGGKKEIIQKGGGIDSGKIFSAMNNLLCKAIIENSLVLMDCVKLGKNGLGSKDFGYFPEIKDYSLDDEKKIDSHKGLRPVFENIFSGTALQTFLSNAPSENPYIIPDDGGIVTGINWENLKSHAPLEIRKLIARRILLNMQVLILYQKCVPSTIRTDAIFEALFLKLDNKKRTLAVMENRGYISSHENSIGRIVEFNNFGFNNINEVERKVRENRTKYFGMLFDDTDLEKKPDWWNSSNTEDDMLQNGFNVVLKSLLPDTVYQMNKAEEGEINTLTEILDGGGGMKVKAKIPDDMKNQDGYNAFVINNAVPLIYPQLKKADDDRFGFLNLNGMESRKAQFCPVTSIADSQPLCSIKTTKSMKETAPRALNYSMEMGLEAPTAAGIYSYYVSLRKDDNWDTDEDYKYKISGVLTGPGFVYQIGDRDTSFDLKNGPLSAVNTFYEILKNISIITRTSFLSEIQKRHFNPRHILRNFFESNIELLMKSGIKKYGDYGQEFTALSKFGATTKESYNIANKITPGREDLKTIPYNDGGNAFRIMVANDRPSAYRGIFMLLFADQTTINTRSMLGYWNSMGAEKNTLVHGGNALKKVGENFAIRLVDDVDQSIESLPTQVAEEAKQKGRLKNVLYIRRSERQLQQRPRTRDISIFFRQHPDFKQWTKPRGIIINPTNFIVHARQFAEDTGIDITNLELRYPRRGGMKKKKNKKK